VLTAADRCACASCVTATRAHRERLRLAVTALDARGPADWRSRVDVDRLDLDSVVDCVLGQVFGGYATGLRALYGPNWADGPNPGDDAFCDAFPVELWLAELTRDRPVVVPS
jgi:hypothetical protein